MLRPVFTSTPDRPDPPSVGEPDARVEHVPESVLQALWADRRFDAACLTTASGEAVEILHPGTLNRDGGPDFRNARLRIGAGEEALLWVGDVEIHRTSGEWMAHRHNQDPAYDGVVLHVVLLPDRHTGLLQRSDGTPLPEVVLHGRLQESLRRLLYRFFAHPRPDFPCAELWSGVPEKVVGPWLRRLGAARLRSRAATHAGRYVQRPDLDQLLYEAVLRALGYAKNAEAMSELARRVPLARLHQLTHPRDAEAALFGVSGLLPDHDRYQQNGPRSLAYIEDVSARFEALRHRYALAPMRAVQWQFFRLRPPNFPTRRIAQAAALFGPGGSLHADPAGTLRAALEEKRPLTALRKVLSASAPDEFWDHHVRFDRPTKKPLRARLGRSRADRIISDAALPILLLDAEQRERPEQHAAVEDLVAALPGGDDEIIRHYTERGTKAENALVVHGLHQLYREWCSHGRCLDCAVGQYLLRTTS